MPSFESPSLELLYYTKEQPYSVLNSSVDSGFMKGVRLFKSS